MAVRSLGALMVLLRRIVDLLDQAVDDTNPARPHIYREGERATYIYIYIHAAIVPNHPLVYEFMQDSSISALFFWASGSYKLRSS